MLELAIKNTYIQQLKSACDDLSIDVDDTKLARLVDYLELLFKWNKAYNLTAIRDPKDMLVKHIIDSLSIVPFVTGSVLADVGTGPGLPGIPLAILFPEKQFTLIDSNGKKTRFLTQVKMSLSLDNVRVVHGRVEDLSEAAKFDQISSRAFTALDNMVNLCEHLLTDDGSFLAMKGLKPDEEIDKIKKGFKVSQTIPLSVPGCEDSRHLIIIRKNN